MGYYNELISGLKENFAKALSDLDSLLLNIQELLTSLEAATGGDVELIREDLQKYYDAYSKIKETSNTRINDIKSRADEYDGWYVTCMGRVGERNKYLMGGPLNAGEDGSYTTDVTFCVKTFGKVEINKSGLIRQKINYDVYKGFSKLDIKESHMRSGWHILPEMSNFTGGPWEGTN